MVGRIAIILCTNGFFSGRFYMLMMRSVLYRCVVAYRGIKLYRFSSEWILYVIPNYIIV